MAKAKKRSGSKKVSSKSSSSPQKASEFDKFERLLSLMGEHGLSDFEWEKGNERIVLRKQGGVATSPQLPSPFQVNAQTPSFAPQPLPAPAAAPAAPPAPAEEKLDPPRGATSAGQKEILSPFVGTFYRAASPSADPYIKEGASIKPGQVLCIVEAMKLMNEIESEVSGKVVQILAENGQPVEYGEPLFVVEL